jgi:site-specific DNA-methyltransferase (adenine-specific)
MTEPNIELLNIDCLLYMKQCEDKQFDLAIVDPPYGIGAGSKGFINRNTANKNAEKFYRDNDWDKVRPTKEYFDELKRISKNQIVWGGNYFTDLLEPARCYIVWDKKTGDNSYADCELAWTSFDTAVRKYKWRWWGLLQEDMKNKQKRIHPTEKPVQLYKWLLENYAESGSKIIDTHLGSGSIAIACDELGFDLTGIEICKEYFDKANKRTEQHRRQQRLF